MNSIFFSNSRDLIIKNLNPRKSVHSQFILEIENKGMLLYIWIFFSSAPSTGVSCNQATVHEKVDAVLGKNITLSCRINVGSNISLTQSSWVRLLPTGTITLAVYNPEDGIFIPQEYARRVSFVAPSVRDATIVITGASFADIGTYICKVATFPLGNTQTSTFVNVLGKIYLQHFCFFCCCAVVLALFQSYFPNQVWLWLNKTDMTA